jgi:hypothetical protein
MSELSTQGIDPFAAYTANPIDQIPWASDNKEPEKLLEEFLAGPPPMQRNRRVGFVVFHRVDIDSRPEGGQYKKYRQNRLHVLYCQGTGAQTSVIQQYAMMSKALLYYWFPKEKQKPMFVSTSGPYDTYISKEPAEPFSELAKFCEMMKGVGADTAKLRTEKEALEKKVKELEAQAKPKQKVTLES